MDIVKNLFGFRIFFLLSQAFNHDMSIHTDFTRITV